jgi:DNA-binding Xre family transcriptional regulator
MISHDLWGNIGNYCYLCKYKLNCIKLLDRWKTKDINRLKVVLAEKKRTNKWLAEQLGKDPATVSKWCTNTTQPGLETLLNIAKVLEVDVKELLNSSKSDVRYIKVE